MPAEPHHLRKQVEQIADTTPGATVSVIVQMPGHEDLSDFLDAAAEAVALRRSTASARALVPPRRDKLAVGATGHLTPTARRRLSRDASPAALTFLADFSLRTLDLRDVLAAGRRALRPLLDSDFVKSVTDRRKAPPAEFYTSGSVVLEMSKDELAALPKQVPEASDIFPNRLIKVPPVVPAAGLPPAVADNQRYTWGVSRTGALACWGAFGARGAGVRVAVLDTGFDPDHPDLKGKLAGFAEFDRIGQTVTDDVAKAYDDDSHGTHCAGTIVGGSASGRWIGMAPEGKILSGLVLKGGAGTDAQILAGLEWAVTNKADVISLSLGGLRMSPDVLDTYTRTILNANRLGIPVVVAAGNDGSQTTGSPGNDVFAFTVGATDIDDRPAGFSGGRTQVVTTSRYIDPTYLPLVYSKPEVTAPGVDVYSAVPGGKWAVYNGTSMATPHVAGAMALLLSKPTALEATTSITELSGRQKVNVLQQLLMSTVKELGEAGQDHRYGYGRIDVLRAFGYAVARGYFGEKMAED
jgi:subtilisin family serine protease